MNFKLAQIKKRNPVKGEECNKICRCLLKRAQGNQLAVKMSKSSFESEASEKIATKFKVCVPFDREHVNLIIFAHYSLFHSNSYMSASFNLIFMQIKVIAIAFAFFLSPSLEKMLFR